MAGGQATITEVHQSQLVGIDALDINITFKAQFPLEEKITCKGTFVSPKRGG